MRENTIFVEQFSQLKKELTPIIYDIIDKNNIGDNVALFYFAGIVKEGLKEKDDQQFKEAVLRFIFDE